MSNTSFINYIVIFSMVFLGLITLYGMSLPGFQNAVNAPKQCLINNEPARTCSFPAFSPPTPANVTYVSAGKSTPFPQCLLYIPTCFASEIGTIQNTAQAIANGFGLLNYAVALIPIYLYVFFNKLLNVMILFTAIFNIVNTDYGVPFLTYFMFAFTLLTIIGIVAILKPGGHGG